MEKILNDLKYCGEYYRTIEEDSKCCGDKITYEYLTKCCNIAELNNVYEIVMKLFATNYILTVDYIFFLNNFQYIMGIFWRLKNEEELFLKHSMYYDSDYLKKMRHLHIFKLYNYAIRIDEIIKKIDSETVYNHSKIVIDIFYKLYLNGFLEKTDILNCFKGGMTLYNNLTHCNIYGYIFMKEKYEKILHN